MFIEGQDYPGSQGDLKLDPRESHEGACSCYTRVSGLNRTCVCLPFLVRVFGVQGQEHCGGLRCLAVVRLEGFRGLRDIVVMGVREKLCISFLVLCVYPLGFGACVVKDSSLVKLLMDQACVTLSTPYSSIVAIRLRYFRSFKILSVECAVGEAWSVAVFGVQKPESIPYTPNRSPHP